ncbi:MAG: hypothetical protein M0T70_16820 [Geobacteraceae bacterium]|nr:hypothetical protein [Geobacteraceae bacterium]
MKKGINIICLSLLVLLCKGPAFASVALPWQTTYNCADWTQTVNPSSDPVCDGLTHMLDVGPPSLTEQITSTANNPNGAGGKGQRHWMQGQGGTCTQVDGNSGGTRIDFNSSVNEIWVRFYLKFQPGFTWTNYQGYKLLYFNHDGFSNFNYFQIGENGSDGSLDYYTQFGDQSHYSASVGYGTLYGSPASGAWHSIEVHIKSETSSGAKDGILQMWVDGVLKANFNNVNHGFKSNNWSISGFVIGSNIKCISGTTPQYSDYDDIYVTSTLPANKDASGNSMIGPIGWSGVTGGTADTTAPTTPANLSAAVSSSSQINLSWNASTDNVGVTGYKIYRGGIYQTTVTGTTYSDTGLTASTQYIYEVSAIDAAGNESGKSSPASTTTSAAPSPITLPPVTPPASTGTVLFSENFESSNFAANGWYDVTNFVRSSSEYEQGAYSAQFLFNSGAITPTSGGSIRHLFTPTDTVYLSYWRKYDSNWKEQQGNLHHEIYLLTNKDGAYTNLAFTHLTTYSETWGTYNATANVKPEFYFQDGANIDQTKINTDLTNVTEARGANGCNGVVETDPTISTTCYNSGSGTYWNGKWINNVPASIPMGKWHHVEMYVKLNSVTNNKANADGTAIMWVDGVKQIEKYNLLLRTAQYPDMQFNQLVVGPFMANGSPQTQSLYLDNLEVRNGMPPTLAAPANLKAIP